MARALDALVKWYRTGEAADRRAYDVAWVEDKASPVDTINGFTEVYLDARGVKGSWEALVFYVNREKTEAIKRLAAEAQWFEDHMPWDPKYRKPNVTGITANAIDVVIETGDAGPVSPIGINLPNDERFARRTAASRCRSRTSARRTRSRQVPACATSSRGRRKSPPAPRSGAPWPARSRPTCTRPSVTRRASSRTALNGKPEAFLKEHFSALEEARADLIGLYFIADPKTAELGIVASG